MFRQEDFGTHQTSSDHADGPSANSTLRGKPLRDGGWHESSWELCQGLEISDLEGDLPEEFRQPIKARQ